MARPSLRTVTRTQGATRALKNGVVAPERHDLEFVDVPTLVGAFRRMVRATEFEICEMALTTYLCAKEHGKPFTALPVFLVRAFHHGAIVTRDGNGVREPKDLEGRRVGVSRGYTVTGGVWARAVLRSEHGVDLDRVTWVLSGDEHVAEYRPPANVEPAPAGRDLTEMLLAGDLAAVVGVAPNPAAGIVTLIPDAEEAGYTALRERGYYPINHLVVVRDDRLAEHPDLAADVTRAFAASKTRYVEGLRDADPGKADGTYRRIMEITGRDPLPYGIAPNEQALNELIGYAVDQGILARRPDLSTIFADGTHDFVG
jgi:4,5-dihydroxyphthalate decarboxylase